MISEELCIVSEWMEHENMHTYIVNNETAERFELVSLRPRPLCSISDESISIQFPLQPSSWLNLKRRRTF